MAKKKATKKTKTKTKTKKKEYHHGYWAKTEPELINPLSDEFKEAWFKLREFGDSLGPQKIYASGKAIMFSKEVCYFFVRPKKSYLEVVIFLRRQEKNSALKVQAVSKTKFAHIFKLTHPDQVEEPLTDWIREAYSA